ncbi:MAG: SpoIIE family protein phosphatase, partial [Candidatus Cloacimonadaceae bacterium]|nr:SpoIIE family protein phosphatase [Candidatus Cloacimonadaceae bacterium]
NYTIFGLAEQYDDPLLRRIGQEMISGKTGFRKIIGNTYFKDKWIYFMPLSSNRWSMAIIIDRKEIFADLTSLILITILTSIVTFLATAWIIYFKTYQVHRPLQVLAKAANQIGSGEFEVPLPVSSNLYEIQTLTDSFTVMQKSLKDYIANLKRITEEKNKIFTEVVFASDIQKSLIPPNEKFATTREEIRAFGILEPAGEIGGDLYDYFMIDENHFCFGIADVLGKGIVAAMTMTMVTTLLRSIAPYYETPYDMLTTLNTFLCKNEQESNFVTIILGIIDLRTGQLCFSNAGHVPLYLRKKDRRVIRFGETHSTAIGVFDDIKIGSEILQLDPGDELIMFTDGITEAMSSKEILFGTERLEDILNKLQNPLPETTASAILNGVRQFSDPDQFRDDITILIVEFIHPRK